MEDKRRIDSFLDSFPQISEVLIENLRKRYALHKYTWKTSCREIDFRQGQQDVVDFLEKTMNQQRKGK